LCTLRTAFDFNRCCGILEALPVFPPTMTVALAMSLTPWMPLVGDSSAVQVGGTYGQISATVLNILERPPPFLQPSKDTSSQRKEKGGALGINVFTSFMATTSASSCFLRACLPVKLAMMSALEMSGSSLRCFYRSQPFRRR
jgi:hypothetical protein